MTKRKLNSAGKRAILKLAVLVVLAATVFIVGAQLAKDKSPVKTEAVSKKPPQVEKISEYQSVSRNANWDGIEVTNPTDTVAVIEFGSTGYKKFVYHFNRQQLIPQYLFDEYVNDNVLEGIGPNDTKEFVKRLQKDISLFRSFFKVASGNIHLKFSSGFMNSPAAKNIIGAYQSKGYITEVVNIEDEGKYGALTAVPAAYRDAAVYVDLGGSNTKGGSWLGSSLRAMTYKYGAKSLQKKFGDNWSVQAYRDEVKTSIKSYFAKNPIAARNGLVMFGGGTPFIASNMIETAPADFQQIQLSQLQKLIEELDTNPDKYYKSSAYDHVTGIYDPNRLLAGLVIMEAIINYMDEVAGSPTTIIITRCNNWAVGKSMLYTAKL
jgi:hypothetical protein